MKIKKENLLILAGIVWFIAGFNIMRIGLEAYTNYITVQNISFSVIIFLIFWFLIFYKLTIKHTKRITKYSEELQFFLKFFDIKSFCIMAFMMTLGITIRLFHLVPNRFIAIFYTGLGFALLSAGLLFEYHYYKYKKAVD